ncbi:hypothetical protein JMUB7519_28140 [Staphylococcus aureus]
MQRSLVGSEMCIRDSPTTGSEFAYIMGDIKNASDILSLIHI